MIKAFHSLILKNSIADYNILIMILSALMWRKNMGYISLYTNEETYKFIKKYNLDILYDDVKITKTIDINTDVFWAGNKILSLKEEKAPIVMIDIDMIVLKDISYKLKRNKIIAIHNEPIIESIYKEKNYFNMKDDYIFDYDLDWSVLPSNTALLYIKDEQFKNYYCNKSIDFMKNIGETKDTISYMVFAEQRMLSMCAKQKNIDIDYLIKFPQDIGNQDEFVHIWGYKSVLEQNKKEQIKFCKRCVKKILSDFPYTSLFFLHFDFIKKYL